MVSRATASGMAVASSLAARSVAIVPRMDRDRLGCRSSVGLPVARRPPSLGAPMLGHALRVTPAPGLAEIATPVGRTQDERSFRIMRQVPLSPGRYPPRQLQAYRLSAEGLPGGHDGLPRLADAPVLGVVPALRCRGHKTS